MQMLHTWGFKTPKTMSESCFQQRNADGKEKEFSSFLPCVAESAYKRCVVRFFLLVYLWDSFEQIVKFGMSSQTHGRMG